METADKDDIVETTEDIDSEESLRLKGSDGLRGGRAGEVCDICDDLFLGGSRGGGAGAAEESAACPERVIVGGGSTGGRVGPIGSLPMPLFGDDMVL